MMVIKTVKCCVVSKSITRYDNDDDHNDVVHLHLCAGYMIVIVTMNQHHHDIIEQMIAYMKVPAEDAGYMIVVMNW